MIGSPARFVVLIVARRALPFLIAALAPLHSLLYSRVKMVLVSTDSNECVDTAVLSRATGDVRAHLDKTVTLLPQAWLQLEPFAMHNCLFQMMEQRNVRWSQGEATKYAGFANMKENDMPGLRRVGVEQRVANMGRDRHDDELARLLKKHEKAGHADDDEPGVD
jgi:hypothetical protein